MGDDNPLTEKLVEMLEESGAKVVTEKSSEEWEEEEELPLTEKEIEEREKRDHNTKIHWKIQSELFGIESFDLLQNAINKVTKEIHLARRCINFQGFTCNNKDCKNFFCPLNALYEKSCLEKVENE